MLIQGDFDGQFSEFVIERLFALAVSGVPAEIGHRLILAAHGASGQCGRFPPNDRLRKIQDTLISKEEVCCAKKFVRSIWRTS